MANPQESEPAGFFFRGLHPVQAGVTVDRGVANHLFLRSTWRTRLFRGLRGGGIYGTEYMKAPSIEAINTTYRWCYDNTTSHLYV